MRWSNRTGGITELDLLSLIFMGANTLAMLHIDSQQRVQLLALGTFHSYGPQSTVNLLVFVSAGAGQDCDFSGDIRRNPASEEVERNIKENRTCTLGKSRQVILDYTLATLDTRCIRSQLTTLSVPASIQSLEPKYFGTARKWCTDDIGEGLGVKRTGSYSEELDSPALTWIM
ncbi:hypothetical protein SCLCIDRAFT_9721 [Scleroderma citrinum Foug A]|uniref:Uncharacterized protein n=1 Tax=Scleroderma citrinum Foug A TaxID=1036808 RepID=A0A0C2ZFG8_9AGAM|nr:hypothetical protein SCLCIDRAFT_9721 [Scleroderma citrinum Foug A]